MEDTQKNIPQYVKDLMNSQQLFDLLNKIEADLELHIDQTGELYVIICEILLQQQKSADFVKNVMERLEVTQDTAFKIGEQVNKNIFATIKDKMQSSIQPGLPTEDFSSLEQAGGFSVEKRTEEHGVPVETQEDVVEHKDDILAGIENPTAGNEKISRKEQTIERKYLEPLIDHLLKGSVTEPQQKTPPAPVPTPPAVPTPPPPKRSGPDPYREDAII